MLEVAPDAFAAMGLNVKHFPVVLFFGTVGLWATDMWFAIDDVKQFAAELRADRLAEQHKTQKVIPVKPTETQ